MYSPFDPLPQAPPPRCTLKRTRSTSPGGSALNKKRAPPSYQPPIYSHLPPHLAHSFSSDGIHQPQPQSASGSGSGSSTPGVGGDWVTRTEGLMLATPPPGERGWAAGAGAGAASEEAGGAAMMEEDVGMGGDIEMDSDYPPPAPPANFQPPPPTTFPHSHSHSHHTDPQPLPHHAPPLYQHLTGSPQLTSMSRSSSSSSSSLSSEMSLSSYPLPSHPQDQHQDHQAPLLAAGVPTLSHAQKRTGGGWKVTFGFRHDCHKCLERVPGHYSHVVSDEGVFRQ